MDDRFLEYLASLSEKIKFCAGNRSPKRAATSPAATAGSGGTADAFTLEDIGLSPAETLAGRDTLPELERLRIKAAMRVRTGVLYLAYVATACSKGTGAATSGLALPQAWTAGDMSPPERSCWGDAPVV